MRKVMIATPSYDGKLDVNYIDSLLQTIAEGQKREIQIVPIFVCYDAMIQRCRNDLFQMAHDSDVECMIYIDSDVGWLPEMFFELLNSPEHIVGGCVRKKTDFEEIYSIRIKDKDKTMKIDKNGLIEVSGVATGFLKIDRYAIDKLWKKAPKYYETKGETKTEKRMVFNVTIKNEDLISEDISFCNLWTSLKEKVFINPFITCSHTGTKTFFGSFINYIVNNKILENPEVLKKVEITENKE